MARAVKRYLSFYLDHMRLEEEVILPAAQRVLDDQDWVELDATYDRLFTRIATCAPAPIVLGKEA